MSRHFQKEVQFLGAQTTPAFVSSPEGKGCAERFIKTLKKKMLWLKWFQTVEKLRQASIQFQQTYDQNWIIKRNGYQTPNQVRDNQKLNTQIAS